LMKGRIRIRPRRLVCYLDRKYWQWRSLAKRSDPSLESKTKKHETALVTGATSGIGKATAQILAQNNYKIALRTPWRPLGRGQKELSAFTEVHTLTFDVRDKSGFRKY
jgi:hypothetical protein